MARRNRLLFSFAVAAAAGAAALGGARAQDGASNAISDVQIGERGALTRIALICRTPCRLESRAGGRFFLAGVDGSMELDLAARSRHVEGLSVKPADGGVMVSVRAGDPIDRSSVRACRISGVPAACIDLEFAGERKAAVAEPAPESKPAAPTRLSPDTTTDPTPPAATTPAPALREAEGSPPAQPVLRDDADAGALALRDDADAPAPPERLAPPRPTLAAATPELPRERRPILRTGSISDVTPESAPLEPSNFAAAASAILGKTLTSEACDAAESKLKKDAWALDAMIDVGFCQAARGALEEADGVFKRLLAYTPDNYEALVGRALIAQEAGEKSVARKYFQDALNALPPIEESNRIVEAMNRL